MPHFYSFLEKKFVLVILGSNLDESVFNLSPTNDDETKIEDDTDEGIETEGTLRPMISNGQRAILTKQHYQIVGGHSAVKMCRWTKRYVVILKQFILIQVIFHSMLKGNGGCYKHTFYGIESHLCMETTPSLACANKCVFCWRHHKNPVLFFSIFFQFSTLLLFFFVEFLFSLYLLKFVIYFP